MKMARDMPRHTGSHRSRHASAVVYRGQAAGFGFNSMKSHPFQAKYGKNTEAIFLHSEVDAIKNSLKTIGLRELARSTLYVVRVKQVSSTDTRTVQGMSCPCEGCARARAVPVLLLSLTYGRWCIHWTIADSAAILLVDTAAKPATMIPETGYVSQGS